MKNLLDGISRPSEPRFDNNLLLGDDRSMDDMIVDAKKNCSVALHVKITSYLFFSH